MGVAFLRDLQAIGFASYDDYLRSEMWRLIRDRVFATKGRECRCCGKTATQIHHRSYARTVLEGISINPLEPICAACHDHLHGKRDLGFANREFHRLTKQRQPVTAKKPKQKKPNPMTALLREMAEIACKEIGVVPSARPGTIDKLVNRWNSVLKNRKQ